MAQGDFTLFHESAGGDMRGDMQKFTNVFHLGAVTVAPTKADALPHWGGTGTVDHSLNEADTGGSSYTGPLVLTTQSTNVGGVAQVTFAVPPELALDLLGPTNIVAWVLFNNTLATKRAYGWIEDVLNLRTSPRTIQFPADYLFRNNHP